MKHFKIFAKQHGLLTIKPTFRNPMTKVPLPDIDIEFHRGVPIWDSSKSNFNEEQLEEIRAAIEAKVARGEDAYTFLKEEDEAKIAVAPEQVREVTTGARSTQHQVPKKVSDK